MNKGKEQATISNEPSSVKRTRTDATVVGEESPAEKKVVTEANAISSSAQRQPEKARVSALSSSDYAVSERKPSFKKADKPGFGHYKSDTVAKNKGDSNTNIKTPTSQSTRSKPISNTNRSKPTAGATATPIPIYDPETIAYYQQMGYSYDPNYAAVEENEVTAEDDDERRPTSRATSQNNSSRPAASATTSYSYPHNTFGHHIPYPGHLPHIPSPLSQGMPAMPPGTSATAWGRSASVPFGLDAGGHAHGRYPYQGMMPPGPFPPPPVPMPMPMPMPRPMAGSRTGGSMDEEALSNLIMAWYYSGYYTGLYQASRR
jgi:hypothetical protein